MKAFRYFTCFVLLLSMFLTGCKDNIHRASIKGDVKVVRILISEGQDINQRNRKGKTPIFLAIKNNKVEVVKVLIDNGADLTLQDEYIATPLHYAANIPNIEIARMLVDAGANVDAISDRTNYTPLCYAVIEGHIEIIKFLLERGADNNVTLGYNESTLLHMSINDFKRPMEVTQTLLESGLDINALDKEGRTPLHVITYSLVSRVTTAKFLLENGADATLKDDNGMTALDYAKKYRKTELVQLLESYGVRKN